MRRFKPIGLFLLGFLLVEVSVRLAASTWERYSPDDYALRVVGCAKQPREFVLVGGSPVSEGLDPARMQGMKFKGQVLQNGYAIGLPGGTTTDVFYAVKHGCQKLPRLMVYGIAPSDLNDSRNEPHGVASLMSFHDVIECVEVRSDARSWFLRNYWQSRISGLVQCWHYKHGMRMWAADNWANWFPNSCPEAVEEARRQADYADRLQQSMGYAPAKYFATRRYSDMKQSGWEAPPFEYLGRYKTGSHLKFLHKLAERCATEPCELVIVEMPLTADLEARHPNEVTEYRRVIRQTCEQLKLTRFVATRTAVSLTDDDFADLIHLNAGGAAKLTDWLKIELEGQP